MHWCVTWYRIRQQFAVTRRLRRVDLLCVPLIVTCECSIQCNTMMPGLYRRSSELVRCLLASAINGRPPTGDVHHVGLPPITSATTVGIWSVFSRRPGIVRHILTNVVLSAQRSCSIIGSLVDVRSLFSETSLYCRMQTKFQIVFKYFYTNFEKWKTNKFTIPN